MVWVRSHIFADMVWDLNGISHGMVYSWDIPLGVILEAILGATFRSYIAAAE